MIPVIETERLILRAPRMEDFDAFAAICASPRSAFPGGPLDRAGAWLEFAAILGQWALRGYGGWSIERREDGAYVGEVALFHPPHFPEPELGWSLVEEAEGHGYATEAARAVLGWARGRPEFATLVSYIPEENARSAGVARRLGARLDTGATGSAPGDRVWRHLPAEATE